MQLGPSSDASDGDDQLPAPGPPGPPGPAGMASQIGSGGECDEEVRHPEVVVELTGQNGNAFTILGSCSRRCAGPAMLATSPSSWRRRPAATTTSCSRPACWVTVT